MAERKAGVLFVCTGNICRSPTAEGVFRRLAGERGMLEKMLVDSAGTHDYHVGEAPDPRAVEHAARRGYDLAPLRARQVTRHDFDAFDRILAMDRSHLRQLQAIAPPGAPARISMFLDHSQRWRGLDVPDPYYGGSRGFEEVLDMVEEASALLLEEILAEIPAELPRRRR
ncbi:MAG TPA: low molecular weight protein-tyrosine-phosphatase [Usitatibacteraceae bacterium]|nr:low molecular weight protein-tyrosine-phosphatase [Usitatibacteraceae bacterium]